MKPEWQKRATNQQLVSARFCACNVGADFVINDMTAGKAAVLIKSMSTCTGSSPLSFGVLGTGRTRCHVFPISSSLVRNFFETNVTLTG
jgi:alpha-D-ribose 1-methylphosphonate 5-triphosphate synthase subunit PhnG